MLNDDVGHISRRRIRAGHTSVEDVLRRALEAQDAEESWTDEERRALLAHIELIDGAQARREVQAMKETWRERFNSA